MVILPYSPARLIWLGDSLDVISAFPDAVKRQLGFGIRQVQNGLTPQIAKPLKGFSGNVYELRADGAANTYRVVYLVRMTKGVYVLDAFVKKSKSGIGIPREDRLRIGMRLKRARRMEGD